jgi:hypothetical protein
LQLCWICRIQGEEERELPLPVGRGGELSCLCCVGCDSGRSHRCLLAGLGRNKLQAVVRGRKPTVGVLIVSEGEIFFPDLLMHHGGKSRN